MTDPADLSSPVVPASLRTAVPASLVDRATAWLAAPGPVAAPRDAATVVLLRDSAEGVLQTYLLRRTGSMAFAAGMHVFPGGAVDPRDRDVETAWAGPPPAAWGAVLGCDATLARALVCAAVRETFEEAGVLLAGSSAEEVVSDTTDPTYEADRTALLDRSVSIAEMLSARGLVLRSDLLRAWAHWITPEFEPRRYDTRFFVAAVPSGQVARDLSTESDAAEWVGVRDAVSEHVAGRMPMLPPTVAVLRDLAAFVDVAAVLAGEREIRPVLPRLVVGDAGIELEA